MDTPRRRMLSLVGSDRPVSLVKVHGRQWPEQIHIRFIISVNRSDISPVTIGGHASARAAKTIGRHSMSSDNRRKNVLSEVVRRIAIVILLKQPHEQIRGENIHAHRGKGVRGIS